MVNSLYIHIPFCRRKCIYCDFYSAIYDDSIASDYVDIISKEINSLGELFDTIYIGGGTPSVLNKDQMNRLFTSIKNHVKTGSEFTVEVNPESTDNDKIRMMLDMGVNRLSIGMQSLMDSKLNRLGRLHDSARAKDAVNIAARCGVKNISIDLIFGVWGEDRKIWEREVEEAVKLPVKHISCYNLTYEKGTPLFSALRNRTILPIEDDEAAGMYEYAIDRLSLAGFKQYEVSNFAIPSYECRHNINYWENNQYIGIGSSAVSYIDGVRSKRISDIKEYIKRSASGKPLVESSEKLTPVRRAKESASVKIRTREGIDFEWFRGKTGFDFMKLEKKPVEELLEKGLIKYKRQGQTISGICLKRKGFLFCDTVSSTLL